MSDEPTGHSAVLGRGHIPALDGIRALAVSAVIAFHLGLPQVAGGYLGVDLFFVLSGFLITSLLVRERSTSGTISLPGFWARRARRLFPALLAMLAAVAIYAAAGGPNVNPQALWGDTVATLLYVANWHFIAANSSYFNQFTSPSPLEHTWSLAIEEQFYVVWPLLMLLFARFGGRRWRRLAIVSTVGLALASVLTMALLAHGASNVSRAYFGTDSRAFELMTGALLALWSSRSQTLSGTKLRMLHGAGVVAAGLVVTGFFTLGGPPRWMFYGGFVAIAVLAAVVIASVSQPNHGPLGALLSLPPVRWVGMISYGLYLWHWPVCVFLTTRTTGLPGATVDVLRVAISVTLATVCFYALERPILRHGVPGFGGASALVPAGLAAASVLLVLGTIPAPVAGAAAPPPTSPTAAKLFALGATPSATRPLRVMLIGDSVMQFASTGLVAALKATHVVVTSSIVYPGWGLTTDRYWRTQIPEFIARHKPDIVMGTWSWDRKLAARNPTAYRKLLDQALDLILAPHNGVQGMVFLQFPKTQTPSANRDLQAWNTIVASEANRLPGRVGYLAVANSLELDGHYATWLPNGQGQWVRVRTTDGFHLCPAGTARYASAVVTDLEAQWRLPAPTPTWFYGPWTHAGLYDWGDCPRDHPPHSL